MQNQQYASSFSESQVKSPIIEMPVTPNSTMGKSYERFFSSSENYGQQANASSSFAQRAGPIITPLSPTNVYQSKSFSSTSSSNGAKLAGASESLSASSSMQRTSSFEPVIKQQQQSSSSQFRTLSSTMNSSSRVNDLDAATSESTSVFRKHSSNSLQGQKLRGFGREEEEVELVQSPSALISDKQFKPIGADSARVTPIAVNYATTKSSTSGNRRNNFSSSSYECSMDGANNHRPSSSQQHSSYYSSQTVN